METHLGFESQEEGEAVLLLFVVISAGLLASRDELGSSVKVPEVPGAGS